MRTKTPQSNIGKQIQSKSIAYHNPNHKEKFKYDYNNEEKMDKTRNFLNNTYIKPVDKKYVLTKHLFAQNILPFHFAENKPSSQVMKFGALLKRNEPNELNKDYKEKLKQDVEDFKHKQTNFSKQFALKTTAFKNINLHTQPYKKTKEIMKPSGFSVQNTYQLIRF